MKLHFSILATAAACCCFMLSGIWCFAPSLLLALWAVSSPISTILVARRMAAIFLGLGIMFANLRHAEASVSRSALMAGFIVSCFTLATLGLLELYGGHAGIGILSAVVVELVFAISFWRVAYEDHRHRNL